MIAAPIIVWFFVICLVAFVLAMLAIIVSKYTRRQHRRIG